MGGVINNAESHGLIAGSVALIGPWRRANANEQSYCDRTFDPRLYVVRTWALARLIRRPGRSATAIGFGEKGGRDWLRGVSIAGFSPRLDRPVVTALSSANPAGHPPGVPAHFSLTLWE